MKNVPKIISTKDLSYISDMLNWTHTISKKINHYTEIVEDNDVLKELENCNTLITNIYDKLITTLK